MVNYQPKPFGVLTASQQRMRIGGMKGELVLLDYDSNRLGALKMIVSGLATSSEEGAHEDLLLCSDYYEGGMRAFRLSEIAQLERTEWPITDARHPDYEAPTMVVRPLPRSGR